MGFWARLFGTEKQEPEKRMTLDDIGQQVMKYNGHNYLLGSMGRRGDLSASIGNDFESYVKQGFQGNGIVFACIVTRMHVFSEGRFQFQRIRGGRPEDLFGTPALRLLERPWTTGTTGDLLSMALLDADLAGNHYALDEGDGIVKVLPPHHVDILLAVPPEEATSADIRGYLYRPGGTENPEEWKAYPIDGSNGRIAHWNPIPDPLAPYRGMSWLTPVLREIDSDTYATIHKSKFFENAATPNIAVSFDESVDPELFQEFMDVMNTQKQGVEHAYETLYLAGGADVTVIGADFAQMDFKVTQGAGETRIAAAARVHPVIVGLSEGMQGSSLNTGNFSAAKRSFADGTMRPLWRSLCGAYEVLVPPPSDSRLWIDTRDIAFLREDAKDLAEIQAQEASTIAKLVRDGFTAESVVTAVLKQDWTLLVHSGLVSVQLLPPGTVAKDAAPKEGKSGEE